MIPRNRPIVLLAAIVTACTSTPDPRLQANREIVQRFLESQVTGDDETLRAALSPDVVRHSQATPDVSVRSAEEFIRFAAETRVSFPDVSITVEHMVAEGDFVAVHATFAGTQTGAMGPFPPSGKRAESKFLGILRLDGGQIAEMWVEWDNLAMLAQLGHFPPPAPGT